MVDRALRKELLSRLAISRQALSQRAKRLKETYGPMTTDEAVYIIAHLEGVDISKYVPLATVDRVRALVPRTPSVVHAKPNAAAPKRRPLRPAAPRYPLIPAKLANIGQAMGERVFPVLFQLENSIRALIERTLSTSGLDWWTKRAPKCVQDSVDRTMKKEKRYPYRDPRGAHPLYYANLDDLRRIVIDPGNWPDFQPTIIDPNWFGVKMQEVYMARNNLAHCVPLSEDDESRILLLHRDWARMLEAAGIA